MESDGDRYQEHALPDRDVEWPPTREVGISLAILAEVTDSQSKNSTCKFSFSAIFELIWFELIYFTWVLGLDNPS